MLWTELFCPHHHHHPENSCVETFNVNGLVFGDETFEEVELKEVVNITCQSNGISIFMRGRRHQRALSLLSP
jgi:hypothetical protein